MQPRIKQWLKQQVKCKIMKKNIIHWLSLAMDWTQASRQTNETSQTTEYSPQAIRLVVSCEFYFYFFNFWLENLAKLFSVCNHCSKIISFWIFILSDFNKIGPRRNYYKNYSKQIFSNINESLRMKWKKWSTSYKIHGRHH